MKKYSLLILSGILSLILVGCGNDSLDTFVEDFNQSARKYDSTELIKNEFGEIETEDGESWRNLFNSKEYSLDAYYEKNDAVGYYINVKSDQNSIDKKGKGYNAILTLADSLEVNISDLEKGMQKAFDENFYKYEDGDYNIRISVINITSATLAVTIEEK